MPAKINDHAPETALHEEVKEISAKMEVVLPYLDKLHDNIVALHAKIDGTAQKPSEPPDEPPKNG